MSTEKQPRNHWLPLVLLFIVAASGESFLLLIFFGGRVSASNELPMLKWILLFTHLLPLITARRVIGQYMSESSFNLAGVRSAVWQLFTAYIAMGGMEIGLTMFLRLR